MMARWRLREFDQQAVNRLVEVNGLHLVVAKILVARGLTNQREIDEFLAKDFRGLSAPFDVPNLRATAVRLAEAIRNGERVLVYGDYDVDGTSASAVMLRFFQLCGCKYDFFIPDRMVDGYGLTLESAAKVLARSPQVVVTVDCGIGSVAAVAALRKGGIDVVVTDHHLPGERLPDTPYLINPKLSEGTSFEFLCGAGTAFKLVWGTAQILTGEDKVSPQFRNYLLQMVPLVAIATVADVVPLQGENRLIVAKGLQILNRHRQPDAPILSGIRALIKVSGLDKVSSIGSFDVGFKIGPRMNAAGRLKDASQCVDLLLSDTAMLTARIAGDLNLSNQQRQVLCQQTFEEAVEMADSLISRQPGRTLVLSAKHWHKGIVGIVASKIAEKYHRPTVILAGGDEQWHGSARTVGDFHLKEALDQCAHCLLKYGGHRGAAGMSLGFGTLDAFRQCFEKTASILSETDLLPVVAIDCEVLHSLLTIDLAEEMASLEPFGEANRRPVLLTRGLALQSVRTVGKEATHLKLNFTTSTGVAVGGIAFGMGDRYLELSEATLVDVIFYPTVNEWQGRISLDLQVKDIVVTGVASL